MPAAVQLELSGLRAGPSRLHLYTGNRLEVLARELAEVTRAPLQSVFTPEIVVVPSLGMRRWLSLELAQHHGICANFAFPFVQRFVVGMLRQALGKPPDEAELYARETMAWRIYRLLPELSAAAATDFAEVRAYLENDRPHLRRYQLAQRIAAAFDQYLIYRPEWIVRWSEGAEKHWQAQLWRALEREAPGLHPPARARELAQCLARGENVKLPERVSVFGHSTLPPFFLDFISTLATRVEVHLFVLEPTPEYWSDILSQREIRKKKGRIRKSGNQETKAEKGIRNSGTQEEDKGLPRRLDVEAGGGGSEAVPDSSDSSLPDLQFDSGNPPLASWGRLGQNFLRSLADLEPLAQPEFFSPPATTTLLGRIQRDIYEVEPRSAPVPADASLQIHSCHNPMRELEVLHDQLLALFDQMPGLEPRDILVMLPDVSAYAPFIEAVFDTPERERVRIPFSIADRGVRASSGVIDTFLRLLEMGGSRFGAASVLALLESPAVLRRFDLFEDDLGTIRHWVETTAIRWGIDAEHRATFDVPAFAQNSWRAGLDRLLLGYALPAGGTQLYGEILPCDEIEGGLAEKLGNFVEFFERLTAMAREIQAPRPAAAWRQTLRGVLEDFFAAEDSVERECGLVREAIEGLGALPVEEPLPLDVLRVHLAAALEESDPGHGFLAGRVTFCALKPMRSLPFRVVCLVGMSDTAFPRHDRPPGFDLIAQNPRRGDRSTRDDDRYLFLEALLSARDVFYVSFLGQSPRDNSELPPSVLVSELIDYAGVAVTRHKLQAFNAEYFSGENGALFSYSQVNCAAAEAARGERMEAPPFLTRPLPEPEETSRIVELKTLVRFFRNPAQIFLEERIGLRLPDEETPLEEREPFRLAPLTNYQLEQDLLARALADPELAAALPLVRAGGQLPPGHPGEAKFREMTAGVAKFAALLERHAPGEPRPPEPFERVLGPWTLRGEIEPRRGEGVVRFRLARLKAKDQLAAWITHLALNCVRVAESRLFAEHEKTPGSFTGRSFRPVENAPEILRALLDLYGRGLRAPLKFFPETSLVFAEKGDRDEALEKWAPEEIPWIKIGESNDRFFDLAFHHDENFFDAEAEEIARAVYAPLLAHADPIDL